MNFPGKFDAGAIEKTAVSLTDQVFSDHALSDQARHFDLTPAQVPHHNGIVVPDAALLFAGDFKRSGTDLIVSHDDRIFIVKEYFHTDKHADLSSPEGATLSAAVVDAMTGYTAYAQASAQPANDQPIGHVVKVSGSATVIRNGVAVQLNAGDNVFKGDVVQSGSDSSVGITFIDGTAFGLQSNARMVLNEMVYDPNGSSNSALMTLVQGTFSFVAGQSAKNGGMKIDTPVATMGIRGTAGVAKVDINYGEFSLSIEPGGHAGSYELIRNGQVIGVISQAGTLAFVSPNPSGQPTFTQRPQTFAEQQQERAIIQQVFQLYFPQYNQDDPNPGSGGSHGSSSPPPSQPLPPGNTTLPPGTPGTLTVTITVTNTDGTTTTTTQTYVDLPPNVTTTDSTGVQAGGVTNVEVTQADTPGDKTFLIADHVTVVLDPISEAIFHDTPVPYVANTGVITSAVGPASIPAGFNLMSLIHIDKLTGAVTYDPYNFRFLGEHEKAVFTIEFDSGAGPFVLHEKITLTINGLDDAPVFDSHDTQLGLSETADTTGSDALISQVAVLGFHDPDFSDIAAGYTVQTTGVTTSGDTVLLPDNATLLSFLHFNSIAKDVGTDVGTITETFSAPDDTFDYLAVGQTVTIVYTILVTDAEGATDTQTVEFTITGTNDTPTITAATTPTLTSGTVTEDGTQTATGTITFSDVDLIDTHTVSQALTDGTITATLPGFDPATQQMGTLSLVVNEDNTDTNAVGTVGWTFTIDNALAQELAVGQTVTQVYTVTIDDGNGGTVTQDVTVTIVGTEDTPTITAATTPALTSGTVTEDGTQTATGTITFSDVDLIDTHTVSQALTDGTITATLPGFDPATQQMGTLSLVVNEDNTDTNAVGTVGWTFTIDNALAQELAVGQTVTQVYTVTIDDGNGGTVTQDVTVTIVGTEDTPTITAATTPALTSGTVTEDGTQTATGTITFSDVDLIDTHTVSQALTDGTITATLPGFDPATQQMGTLSLVVNEDNTDTNAVGTVGWTFTIDNALAQELAVGQTVTQVYTVTIDDGNGGTVTQDVTVTIVGTEDTPTITAATTPALTSGTVTEDGTQTATGTITFSDVDLIDTHTVSQALTDGTITATLPGFDPATQQMGTLSLVVNEDNTDTNAVGTVGWTFTIDNALAQELAVGQTVTQVYTVTIDDGNGGTVTQDVTVTIVGTEDTPTITAATTPALTSGTVTEDGTQTATGTITFSDVDLIDTHTVSQALTDGTITATLPGFDPATQQMGTLSLVVNEDNTDTNAVGTVGWTFTIDNALAQELAVGQTVTQVYTVTIDDGNGGTVTQDITVTITGTEDAPVVAAVLSDAANEGDSSFTKDLLVGASDVDDGETATLQIADVTYAVDGNTATGTAPAGVSLGVDGHTLTVDPTDPSFDHLSVGESTTIVVSYNVVDAQGVPVAQTETITINGTEDAPVVASVLSDTVNEGDTSFAKDLLAGASDVDDGETATLQITDVTYAVDGNTATGTAPAGVSLGVDGHTLTVDPTDPSFDHLSVGESTTIVVSYNVVDAQGVPVAQTETITINGTEDAPVVAAVLSDAANEGDSSFTKDLLVGASDVDDGETATLQIADVTYAVDGNTATGTAPAGVSLGVDGHTLTVDPTDPSFDHLSVGESTTIVVSYNVVDAQGVPVAQTETITINGTEDAPVVASVLSDTVNEGDTSFAKDLLAGASDVDDGETATLQITDVTYAVDGNTATGTAPAGVSLGVDGHTLTVDPTDPSFDHLSVGESTTIVVSYNVVDAQGVPVAQTETITINGINDAPVLTASAPDLMGVSADDTENLGQTVASFLSGSVTDADDGAAQGIAVTGITGDNGEWQFSTDGGTNWTTVVVSATAALLLASDDMIRFVPDGSGSGGTETLTYSAWDQTSGSHGDTVDLTVTGTGGTTAFSDASDTASLTVTPVDGGGGDGAPIVQNDTLEISPNFGSIGSSLQGVDSGHPDAFVTEVSLDGVNFFPVGADGYEVDGTYLTFTAKADGSYFVGLVPGTDGLSLIQLIENAEDNAQVLSDTFYYRVDDGSGHIQTYQLNENLGDVDFSSITGGSVDVTAGNTVQLSGIQFHDFGYELLGSPEDQFTVTIHIDIGQLSTELGPDDDGGTVTFDADHHTMTIVGTEDQIVTDLDALYYTAAWDSSGTFDLTFNVVEGAVNSGTYLIGHVNVEADAEFVVSEPSGYDTTTLYSDILNAAIGYSGDIDASHILAVNSATGHTILIETTGLEHTGTPPGEDVAFTAGVITAIHITDTATGDAILDLTNLDIEATAFSYAVLQFDNSDPSYLNAIFDSLTYHITGSAGADVLLGGDFADLIDTGGGADVVLAGAGNDVILVHDDSNWNIDGGTGINTLRFVGALDVGHNEAQLSHIQIIDLNTTDADSVTIDGVGAATVNNGDPIRVLGTSADTINLDSKFQGHPDGHWVAGSTDQHYTGDGATPDTLFDVFNYVDGATTLGTIYVQQGVHVDSSPQIDAEALSVNELGAGVTQVSGLSVFDAGAAPTDVFTVSVSTDDPDSSVSIETTSGTLSDINQALMDGVTYTPGTHDNDILTLTVTDSQNATDTINFVFSEQGGGATLTGTSGRDFIFSTGGDDSLTGGGGPDTFVFRDNFGHDTITDFQASNNVIQFDTSTFTDFQDVLNHAAFDGTNTVITDSNGDQLTLAHVQMTDLTSANFQFHPFIV